MRNVDELIVISDLHLEPEQGGGAFRCDQELAACLNWVVSETRDCTVVLAGDALDFRMMTECKSPNGFDRFSCYTKQIIEHHPEVFDSLSRIARSPHHTLVIMSGESDACLILPQVQDVLEQRLGLNSSRSLRWLAHGEALRASVGNAVVLVEHGNGFDPWNRVDHADLQILLSLASRNLPEPLESRLPLGIDLTHAVLNDLRTNHRWIDCLRPANDSILPLLWPIASQRQRMAILGLLERYESIKTEAVVKRLGNMHNPAALYQGEPETVTSSRDVVLKEWLDEMYEQQPDISERQGINPIEKIRLISKHGGLSPLDQPNDTANHLLPIFENGTDLVIHGHTHGAKLYPIKNGLYVNTGTWTQLIQLPGNGEDESTWQRFVDDLSLDAVSIFNRPTFAHVKQDQNGTSVSLNEWQMTGPKIEAGGYIRSPQS